MPVTWSQSNLGKWGHQHIEPNMPGAPVSSILARQIETNTFCLNHKFFYSSNDFVFGWINSKQIYWHNIYSLTIWLNVLFISFQKYMYIKIECAHSFYVVSEFCNLEGIQILFASKVKQQRMFKERKAFEG